MGIKRKYETVEDLANDLGKCNDTEENDKDLFSTDITFDVQDELEKVMTYNMK